MKTAEELKVGMEGLRLFLIEDTCLSPEQIGEVIHKAKALQDRDGKLDTRGVARLIGKKLCETLFNVTTQSDD